MHAEPGGKKNERVADVVAVADVSKFEAAKIAEFFLKGEEIGEGLAGMEFVGKGVDDGDAGVGGHFLEDALLVDAGDDPVHPALEVARDIGDGFAFAETGLSVVQEDHGAAHAFDTDLEGDTGAQRGLLENERERLVAEDGDVT